MTRTLLAALACLWLAACDVKEGGVPLPNDSQGTQRVMAELSPWNDGSPDRSRNGQTPGDYSADRQTFMRYMYRYQDYDFIHQHDRDYQPFPGSSSVGEALDEQRAYERRLRVDEAEVRREEVAAREADEARRRAEQERWSAEQAAQQARNQAAAADERQRFAVRQACERRRDEAVSKLDWSNEDPNAAATLYASFAC